MRFEALATSTIFSASELRQNRRALDAAKVDGIARVRDADGTALLVAREEAIGNALQEREWLSRVADMALQLHAIETRPADDLPGFGDLTFVSRLDEPNRAAFVADMWEAVIEARAEASATPIHEAIADWRETSRALNDSERLAKLTAPIVADDFVEIAAQ